MLRKEPNNPVQGLLADLDQDGHIDLDAMRRNVQRIAALWTDLAECNGLYEEELRRELRAKIDLCGGVPGCPDGDMAGMLNGPELLSARRAASLQFNRVFYMAPLTRNARKPENQGRKVDIDTRRVHA